MFGTTIPVLSCGWQAPFLAVETTNVELLNCGVSHGVGVEWCAKWSFALCSTSRTTTPTLCTTVSDSTQSVHVQRHCCCSTVSVRECICVPVNYVTQFALFMSKDKAGGTLFGVQLSTFAIHLQPHLPSFDPALLCLSRSMMRLAALCVLFRAATVQAADWPAFAECSAECKAAMPEVC